MWYWQTDTAESTHSFASLLPLEWGRLQLRDAMWFII